MHDWKRATHEAAYQSNRGLGVNQDGLTIYNYDNMVVIWRLNGKCLIKEF